MTATDRDGAVAGFVMAGGDASKIDGVAPVLDRHDVAGVEFALTPTVRQAIDPSFNVSTPDDVARAQSKAARAA